MQISLAQALVLVSAVTGVAAIPKHKHSSNKDADTTAIYDGSSTWIYPETSSAAYSGSSSSTESGKTSTVVTGGSTTTTVVVVSTSTMTVSASSTGENTSTQGTTTTSSATTTVVSDCATPILNSGFEYTEMVQWRRQYPNPETPYDFKVMSNVTSPHSGNQLASVTYTKGSIGYATWFNQFISLCPSTLYNFNAYTKVSKEGTGCSVSYSIGDRNGTVLAGLVGHSSQDLTTEWLAGTATYRSGTGVEAVKAAIDVRIMCYGTATEERAWYFDDVSLVAARHT